MPEELSFQLLSVQDDKVHAGVKGIAASCARKRMSNNKTCLPSVSAFKRFFFLLCYHKPTNSQVIQRLSEQIYTSNIEMKQKAPIIFFFFFRREDIFLFFYLCPKIPHPGQGKFSQVTMLHAWADKRHWDVPAERGEQEVLYSHVKRWSHHQVPS